jgi:hypothetical protein
MCHWTGCFFRTFDIRNHRRFSYIPKFITYSAYCFDGLAHRLIKCDNVGPKSCADNPACKETRQVSKVFSDALFQKSPSQNWKKVENS